MSRVPQHLQIGGREGGMQSLQRPHTNEKYWVCIATVQKLAVTSHVTGKYFRIILQEIYIDFCCANAILKWYVCERHGKLATLPKVTRIY